MLWNDLFRCKIPHIDAQHKALFEQAERLGDARLAASAMSETIGFLEKYAKEHFADEESLHGQTDYPGASAHQWQHQDFGAKINAFRRQYEEFGVSLPTLMEMNQVIVAWLKEHVLYSDKEFATFYHALPEERKRSLRLPSRPWIPRSSQTFYRELTAAKPKEDAIAPVAGSSASWSDSLLCGIASLDEQHRELFRQLDILREGSDKDRVADVLWFLSDYLFKHFNNEEVLQLRSGYPLTPQHRKMHADFIRTVADMRKKYEQSSDSSPVALEINRVVYDWLREHVLTADKDFGKYYIARGGS